ncbi:MAG: inorganic diphosphatase [Candidatus Micrarchaeales archaeon]
MAMRQPIGKAKQNGNIGALDKSAMIEISSGSIERYELDVEHHTKKIKAVLRTPLPKDLHYGFMPNTIANDKDQLDVIVLSAGRISAGDELNIRPIGILYTKDEKGLDDKLITVDLGDNFYSKFSSIELLPQGMRGVIFNYVKDIKQESNPKDGWIRIESFGNMQAAIRSIQEAELLFMMLKRE